MAREYPTTDISHLPDLVHLAEQVRATGTPRMLCRDQRRAEVDGSAPPGHNRRSLRPIHARMHEYA